MLWAKLCPARRLLTFLAIICLLASPMRVCAQKGEKNFKQGMRYESAQQWEKAAEEFSLAVAADPANPEYQLHFRRAMFNASQALMVQGRVFAEQKDYVGAYNAYRQAYGYDQMNGLAPVMMERMLRAQVRQDDGAARDSATEQTRGQMTGGQVTVAPVSLRRPDTDDAPVRPKTNGPLSNRRAVPLRVINYSGDLEEFIRYIGKEVGLNVIFDRDFPRRSIKVELEDVTAAQALDHIFIAQGLFFERLSRHTIIVADQTKRPQYQQLVVRTFYLSNADPAEFQRLIQAAIPAQAGRQTVLASNKATNSVTVRDTPENVRLIGAILNSIDKERAEVVIDVNIFEVSRSDLMQFGNQLGTEATLSNLGGLHKGLSIISGGGEALAKGVGAVTAPSTFGAALLIPSSSIVALQRKEQTRLIASTQLHAFDGEKSTAHIGQRVPVQTANITPLSVGNTTNGNAQAGVSAGVFGGSGYPVIQYEKTGLTLEFTPQVFQNMDVQVKMMITSNDVANQAATTLTPIFTERNIEGTARIENNRTMMIASVAQNQQSRGRQGLPVLGLLPILGPLFTAPRRSDQQTDIIIAVTPHVVRAPAITPRDEEPHPSGTLQIPDNDSLEALVEETEREEQLAAARLLPTNAISEVAVEPATGANGMTFVPAPAKRPGSLDDQPVVNVEPNATVDAPPAPPTATPKDISTHEQAEARYVNAIDTAATDARPGSGQIAPPPFASAALLRITAERAVMRSGERQRLNLFLKTDAPLELISATLRFDPQAIVVRGISLGGILTDTKATPTFSQAMKDGALLLSIMPPGRAGTITGAGVLLQIEVEALKSGATTIGFDADSVLFLTPDGRKVVRKLLPLQLDVQ